MFQHLNRHFFIATAIALIITLLFVIISIPAARSSDTFNDVDDNDWFHDYVNDGVSNEWFDERDSQGKQLFHPSTPANRAEITKIALLAADITIDQTYDAGFSDVQEGSWYEAYVNTAEKVDIVGGDTNEDGDSLGTFRPGDPVNRAEASKIIMGAFGLDENTKCGNPFDDIASGDWFYSPVVTLYCEGVVSGDTDDQGNMLGIFRPADTVLRAEIAKFISLGLNPPGEPVTPPTQEPPAQPPSQQPPTQPPAQQPPATNEVSVKVSSEPLPTTTLPAGAFYAPVLKVEIKNGFSKDMQFTSVTMRRTGIMADSSIQGVLITDYKDILHGGLVTFGQSIAETNFGNDPIIIPRGETRTFAANVNINENAQTGTLGIQIDSSSSLVITDSDGTAVTPTGTFPLTSPTVSIISAQGVIGKLAISPRTIVGGTQTAPVEIDQGSVDVKAARFRLQEITGNEDVELTYLEVQNNGTASDADYKNIRLVDQNGVIVTKVDMMKNNAAKFSISGITGDNAGQHGGYKIPQGQLRDFDVIFDTNTNTNAATRTINFTMQNDYRVRAIGLETMVGVTPTVTGVDQFPVGDGQPTGEAQNWLAFRQGALTISRSTESPSGKVARGATSQALAIFDIRPTGEDIELQELGFVIRRSGGGLPIGATALSGTVRVLNANDSTIFSISAQDKRVYGTNTSAFTITNNVIGTANTDGEGAQQILNSFYTIKVGQTGKLKVVADIHQNATSTDNYTARITSYKARRVSSNNFVTASSLGLDGSNITIETSDLIISKANDFNPTNIVKGGTEQKIASYSIQAGSAEDMRINAVKIRLGFANGSAVDTDGEFTNAETTNNLNKVSSVTLRDSSGNLLAPSSSITSTSGQPYSINNFVIPKNQTKNIDVYAIATTGISGADNMATELTISVAVGSVSQTTISKSPVIGQNVRLISASTIAIQALGQDGVINVAKILHATEQDASLMQFKIRETANAENMRINKLYLAIRNSDSTLTSYKLFDALNTQTPISSTVPSNKGEVRFDNVSLTVPKGGEKTLLVKASVVSGTTLPSTDTHRDNLRIMISFVEFNGVTSGTTTRVSGGVVIGQASTDSGAVEGTFTAEEPNNFLMVNDPNNMEIGDLVRIDANDDGVFTSTALTNNLLESAPHYIKTVGTKAVTLAAYFKATTNANANATFTLVNGAAGLPTDSALGIADSEGQIAATDQVRIDVNNDGDFDDTTPVNETVTYTVSAFTDGAPDTFQAGLDTSTSGALTTPFGVYVITKTQDTGQLGNTSTSVRQAKLTNYGFASEPHNVQEVEPVIARTGDASKTGTPNIETEMSVFKILAEGVRALETSKIRFEISGSYNFNGGFGPKDFKLDRANPGTGERITGTMTPTGALANPSIVYTPSAGSVGNALVAGAKAAGQTSITIDDGAGGASNISLLAGDRVTFTADTNGGVGYRLVTVTSTQLTVTPALQVGIADNAAITKVTTTNPTLAASSLLESGAVIEFDLDAAGLREEIDSGSSKAYVVLADTTNIKNTGAQGATASSLVRMLGNKATVGANNSLTWHYRLTSNGLDSGALTLSDSYIVTGTNLNF